MALGKIVIGAAKFAKAAKTGAAVTATAATADPEPVSKVGGYILAGTLFVGSMILEHTTLVQDGYDWLKEKVRNRRRM